MQLRKLIFFGTAFGLFAACSDSGGGDGGGAAGTTGGGTGGNGGSTSMGECDVTGQMGSGTDCPAYVTCSTNNCQTDIDACVGSGGPCEPFVTCATGCNSGGMCDMTCYNDCVMNLDMACQSCLSGVASCITSNCQAELNQCASMGTGGVPGGGRTCADFQACCNSLSGGDQSTCNNLLGAAMAGGDLACNAAMEAYVASGQCS